MQTITITDPAGNHPVTVPVSPRADREGNCLDLIVETSVHIGCPVVVELSIRTDGSVVFWKTHFNGGDNTYAHVSSRIYPTLGAKPHAPTEEQRRTVARWWAGIERPVGLKTGVGASLLTWAFDGLSLDEVRARYLDGEQIALTASGSDRAHGQGSGVGEDGLEEIQEPPSP